MNDTTDTYNGFSFVFAGDGGTIWFNRERGVVAVCRGGDKPTDEWALHLVGEEADELMAASYADPAPWEEAIRLWSNC